MTTTNQSSAATQGNNPLGYLQKQEVKKIINVFLFEQVLMQDVLLEKFVRKVCSIDACSFWQVISDYKKQGVLKVKYNELGQRCFFITD